MNCKRLLKDIKSAGGVDAWFAPKPGELIMIAYLQSKGIITVQRPRSDEVLLISILRSDSATRDLRTETVIDLLTQKAGQETPAPLILNPDASLYNCAIRLTTFMRSVTPGAINFIRLSDGSIKFEANKDFDFYFPFEKVTP